MSNNIDEILKLTKEISVQDADELDLTVTEYGEELSKTDDLEFLWVARNTTNIVKNTSRDIKNFSDEKMARNIEGNGAIRLGDEVFVFNKSYAWKVHDLKNLINWIIDKSIDKEELTEALVAIMGNNFIPKLKGLDAVASKREQSTDMIRDTFLYKEWKDNPDLKSINLNNTSAPMWAKDLKHKERRKK